MKRSKSAEIKARETSSDKSGKRDFLVVGIGASAGGVQALREFFENVPANSDMAYVVILHLSPNYDSELAQVLQAVSSIPVTQVQEKVRVEANRVYVVPPNHHLEMIDGFIVVSPNMTVEERRAPVDIFFRTLAESHAERAVAVVLSGTGANGSMGIKRVKEKGGTAFVQNPREAEYGEMPRHSIATDLIDEILTVADIPAKIIEYRNNFGRVEFPPEPELKYDEQQSALDEIFAQLRARTGHDFSNYKRPTLLRRIERRINVRNLPDLPSYAAYLGDNPEEIHSLLKDLLISVTNFFRDRKAFNALENEVVPRILSDKTAKDQIRVWVAGCATGEEAYSLAMLLSEKTSAKTDAPQIQIFATDIDEAAIAHAREGFYTLNDAADVAPERLNKFFTPDGDGFRVRRELREMILFAHHNILKDPPFARLDLATCRNMLIYLNHQAQEQIMETFHFALNAGGFLFLGNSETVDTASDLFAPVDKENRLYQSRSQTLKRPPPLPSLMPSIRVEHQRQPYLPQENAPVPQSNRLKERVSSADLHQQLLEGYAAPSLVVSEEYDLVHVSERARRYLEIAVGAPSLNLLKIIREELRLDLRTALYQAAQRRTTVKTGNLHVRVSDRAETINIVVRPILDQADDQPHGFFLVLFEPTTGAESESAIQAQEAVTIAEPALTQLEEELTRTKGQLRAAIEQYEAQMDEHKAANEELQAINEELRSAGEELETSKEETQSLNEELSTVNQELKVKIEEITHSNNNFQNLINSTDIATIFLDRTFRVQLFTPAAREIFNLIPGDFNRPLSDITNRLAANTLLEDAAAVPEKLSHVEREARTTDDREFLMRMLPYRTDDDRILGVVITFTDITKRKRAEEAKLFLASIVESSEDSMLTVNFDGKITSWNRAAERLYGYAANEIIGKPLTILTLPADLLEVLGNAEKIRQSQKVEIYDTVRVNKDGREMNLEISLSPVKAADGEIIGVAYIARDVTERQRAVEALRRSEAKYRTLFDSIDEGFCVIELIDENEQAIDYRFLEVNPVFERLTGLENAKGKLGSRLTPGTENYWLETYDRVARTGESLRFENYHADTGRWYESYASRVDGEGSRQVAIVFNDITERKEREQQQEFLLKLSDALRVEPNADAVANRAIWMLSEQLRLDRCYTAIYRLADDRADITHQTGNDRVPPMPDEIRLSDFPEALRITFDRSLVIDDVAETKGLSATDRRSIKHLGARALVAATLRKGENNPHWVAVAVSASPRQWTRGEIALIEEVTERTWAAIERARAEEALRASEERLQNSIDIETVGVIFFNNDIEAIDCNDAFLRMSGYTRKELQAGKFSWEEFTPDEYYEASKRAVEEVKTRGYTTPYEKEYIRKDGTRFWAVFAAKRINENEIVEFITDITERKLWERELTRSNELLQATFDSSPQDLQLFKAVRDEQSGEIVDFEWLLTNKHWNEQWGEKAGKSLLAENPAVVETGLFDLFKQVTETGVPISREQFYAHEQFNGWYWLTAAKVEDGFLLSTLDITERKQREQKQRFLIKFSDALRAEPDADAIVNRALQMLAEHLRLDRCYVGIALLDDNRGIFPYQFGNDRVAPMPEDGVSLSDFPEALRKTFDETLVIPDFQNTKGLTKTEKRNFAALGFGALVVANVRKKEKNPYWSINAVSRAPRRWTNLEIQLIEEVTERTWAAVERARAEELLRASEEKFRTLFETIDEGFCVQELIFDERGQIADIIYHEANQAFEHHIGRGDVIGKRASEIFPHIEQQWFDALTRVHQTGIPERTEGYNADTERWLTTHYSAVGGAGSPFIAAVFNDITERKRRTANLAFLADVSEQLIDLSNVSEIVQVFGAKVSEFFGASICVFIEINSAKNEAFVFDECRRSGGQSLIGRYDLTEYITEEFQQTMMSGKAVVIRDVANDSRIRDKEKFAALDIGSFINAPLIRDGEWRFTLGIYREESYNWRDDEVTLIVECAARIWNKLERARAEEAVRQSEEKYRTLFDWMDEGFCIIEVLFDKNDQPFDWRYLEVNPAFEKNNGLVNATGKTILELTPDIEPKWLNIYGRVAETGEPLRFEENSVALNRWFSLYAFRVGAPEERKVAVLFNDITERKRTEANLTFLAEISQELMRLTNIGETMNHVGAKIGAYFGSSACAFAELDETAEVAFINYGWHRSDAPNLLGAYRMKDFMTAEVIEDCRAGEAVIVRDVFDDLRFDGEKYAALGVGSYVSIPLVRNGEWRFLLVVYRAEPSDWRVDEIELIRELTNRVWTRLERARAEGALRESEERLRLATEASELATWEWNLLTDEVFWNARHFELFGMEPGANPVKAEVFFQHIHPDDRALIEKLLKKAIKQKTVFDADFRAIIEGVGVRWMSGYGRIIETSSDGKPVRMSGVMFDITDRKKSEQALAESETRLRLLIESASDYAIFTMTLDGSIDSWNKGAEKVFGWQEKEVLGKFGEIIFTPEDLAAGIFEQEMMTALKEGRVPDERFHVRKDGSRFFVSGVVNLLRDADGKPQGFVKIARDMTESIAAEKALRDREMLQKLVGAQEDERKRIARDLHDELGQQLVALRLKIEKARKICKDDEEFCGEIDEMQTIAKRIDDGVDFLAWELRPASLDDLGLFAALDKYVKEWSHYSGIPAELLASSLKKARFAPEVETNLYRIAQEALNNVNKHAAAETVEVIIERRGDFIVLIVEDNGRGFKPADKKTRGKGLGLIGMKERAALIGGTLEIESAPGKGTTVHVIVPAVPVKKRKNNDR